MAPLVACRGLILNRGVNQGRTVRDIHVGELNRQLGILQDAFGQHLLIPTAGSATSLDHPRIYVNVLAACDHIARAHVFKVKDPAVLVAAVAESKVDACAVLGGGPHEVTNVPRGVEWQLPLRVQCHFMVVRVTCLWPAAGVNHLRVLCSLY